MTDLTESTSNQFADPELLQVFCGVATARSFSRAALQLDLAQPVVTRKIRRLEEQLGVELFIRSNRGCQLTPAGDLLAARAPAILMQLEQLKDEVAQSSDTVRGMIAIGITQVAASLLAPRLIPAMATRWPELRVNMVEAVSVSLIEQVRRRDLHLALVFDPPSDAELVSTPLLMERLHVIGRPGRELAALRKATVADLAKLPLVLPSGPQTVRALLEDAFAEASLALKPMYEANSVSLLRAMALQGLGYTVLTVGGVADDIAAGRLAAVPLTQNGMSIALSLLSTRQFGKLRNVQLVSELISGEVRRMARAGAWPGHPIVMTSPAPS